MAKKLKNKEGSRRQRKIGLLNDQQMKACGCMCIRENCRVGEQAE